MVLKHWSYLLFFFFIISSCQEGETKVDDKISLNEETRGTYSLPDDIATGSPLAVNLKPIESTDPPIKVAMGMPEVTAAQENVVEIRSPGIHLAPEILEIMTPGKYGLSLPVQTKPKGDTTFVNLPEQIESQPPAARDNALYGLQYLDVDQGLSSSYVMDVMEDSRGNLWISTWAVGVSVYNGKTFINYSTSNSLASNYIWCVYEDSKGNIWMGTDGVGAIRYDGESFIRYSDKDGLSGLLVKEIVEDERGNLWFATDGGLSRFDGEHFYHYGADQGLGASVVEHITVGANNKVYACTENGLAVFDGVLFTHYQLDDGLNSLNTSVVYEDSEENLWIGTKDSGVCLFDGYTFFTFSTEQGLSGNHVTTISEDANGKVWIGTANNGISIYDRSSFTLIGRQQGLSSNTIRSIIMDSKDNIWIGTFAGINRYNDRSFQNYTDANGLGGLIVRGICEDQYGNLWFGHSNGATRFTGKTYQHFTTNEGLSSNIIRVILQDSKGNIWFGTEGGGATYFDGTNFYQYSTKNGLSGDVVLCMYEDSLRNIWMGTFMGGITKFDGKKFHHLTTEQGLSSNTIRSICEDDEGNIWFGTNNGGLEKFDGENITHFSTKEGLSSNTVLSLMYDNANRLWIGTENGGINVLQNGEMQSIKREQGLANDIIWSIAEDYDGNVWVGTEKGLDRIQPDQDAFKITNFNKLDGLKGTDFYPNAVFLDSENNLWWGTGKALTKLDLDKYESRLSPPLLTLNNISICGENVDFRKLRASKKSNEYEELEKITLRDLEDIEFDSVRRFSNIPENLILPYNLNEVAIYFSAADWSAPHKVKYHYKMEGISDEWHTTQEENNVVYNYLPEGDYTFYVKAIGSSNIWSETISFNITIQPPWWRTLWAYLAYILLAIAALGAIFTWRTLSLLQQRKRLENLVEERTSEVVHQKELVEQKNKEIIDSITYAKRIQRAILPKPKRLRTKLPKAFILFKPKDIVAGDFYWLEEKGNTILLAAADCTGHGVPGAMVSLICNNTLSRTVREFNYTKPGEILDMVRDILIQSFVSSQGIVHDGMDIALVSWNRDNNKILFAGAHNDLHIFRNGELITLQADRQPIGTYKLMKPFTTHEFQLQEGDSFYMFTDGYQDQFGGPKGKKFKSRQLLEEIKSVQHLSMVDQKRYLTQCFQDWKGELEQVDDVCLIGVKV